jgi:hypothetical protein
MQQELSPDRSAVTAVAAGLAGAIVGAVLGFVLGANIGGNWFTTVRLGTWTGYEATAMVGSAVGAVVAGLAAAWFVRRAGPRGRRRSGQRAG